MNLIYTILITGLMLTGSSENLTLNHQNLFADGGRNPNVEKNIKPDETEKFAQNYPFDANGTVSVSNVNGSITIEASDEPQIKLEVVKTADRSESLAEVEVKIDARQNSFRVEAEYGTTRKGGNWNSRSNLEVNIKLTVPRTASLNEIETVNGSVRVSDFTGYTKISAVNGDVRAINLRGNSNLSTVNGTVEADFQTIESVQKISLETVNGEVHLTVPTDADATIKADTLNGEIINDFGLPVHKGQYVGKDLYGKLGSGATAIKLNSVNGRLSVKHRADGKNPRPVVNLLNRQNSEADDEDSDKDDSGEDAGDIADAKRETAEAMKEQAKAMKQAQKELRKQQPQIDRATRDALKQANIAVNSPEVRKQIEEAIQVQREIVSRDGYFDFANNSAAKIEKKSETFSVKGTPKITVNANGCAVSVRGWDRAEVAYSIKRMSKSGATKPLDYTVNHSDSAVSLVISNEILRNNDEYAQGGGSTRVEIFVPKKSDLNIVTDGQIRLEGVTGNLNLNGGDEAINVRDGGGKLSVISENGLVRIIGFNGELETKTEQGDAYLEGDFSKLSAISENGEIILTLPENINAEIRSNQSKIAFDGITSATEDKNDESTVWKIGKGGAKYQLTSETKGKITVRGKNTLEN